MNSIQSPLPQSTQNINFDSGLQNASNKNNLPDLKPAASKADLQTATFKHVLTKNTRWLPFMIAIPFAVVKENVLKLKEGGLSLASWPLIGKIATLSILAPLVSAAIALSILPFTPLIGLVGLLDASITAGTGKDIHGKYVEVNEYKPALQTRTLRRDPDKVYLKDLLKLDENKIKKKIDENEIKKKLDENEIKKKIQSANSQTKV
jgi:hypothetical protein